MYRHLAINNTYYMSNNSTYLTFKRLHVSVYRFRFFLANGFLQIGPWVKSVCSEPTHVPRAYANTYP